MGNNLAKKLNMKKDYKMILINAPEGYIDLLGELPEDVLFVKETEQPVDFLQLFVKDFAELELYKEKVVQAVKHDGLLWISYPKKSSKMKSDLNRDELWAKMHQIGMDGVSMISINDVWSAMRFRPTKDGGNR
ncbi:MAG: hypothetical protein JWM44_3370 [Bacilli bacterium]|nr:hypothetical protein [Bacilli bacterium]